MAGDLESDPQFSINQCVCQAGCLAGVSRNGGGQRIEIAGAAGESVGCRVSGVGGLAFVLNFGAAGWGLKGGKVGGRFLGLPFVTQPPKIDSSDKKAEAQ